MTPEQLLNRLRIERDCDGLYNAHRKTADNGVLLAETLLAEIDAQRETIRELVEALRGLKRYHAVEGRLLGDDNNLVGLAHNGSQWGPVADPTYEMFELAESVEKWLGIELNAIIAKAEKAGTR